MKRLFGALAAALLFSGCAATDPIYYEEISEAESQLLVKQARELALEAKAMPEHLRGVFVELDPVSVRLHYDGDRHGKLAVRWEIYESSNRGRLTQKDVNPYWIMVYAIGDLDDPEWKLSHAATDGRQPAAGGKSGGPAATQRQKR